MVFSRKKIILFFTVGSLVLLFMPSVLKAQYSAFKDPVVNSGDVKIEKVQLADDDVIINKDIEPRSAVRRRLSQHSSVFISPAVLDFGISVGGVEMSRVTVLRNNTAEDVDISEIRMDVAGRSGFAYKSFCSRVLISGASCNIIVSWKPVARGLVQGVLTVEHSGLSQFSNVEIRGNYKPERAKNADVYPSALPDTGLLLADKSSIHFGYNIKDEATVAVSLVNSGSADIQLKDIDLAGGGKGITLSQDGCKKGMVLKPNGACYLIISWLPASKASITDTLQILHSGARGFLHIPISGSAGDISGDINSVADIAGMIDVQRLESSVRTLDQIKDIKDFKITSLAKDKAVINGAAGAFLVHKGENVKIGGARWIVDVVSGGVVLKSHDDEAKRVIKIKFDRDLKPALNERASSDFKAEEVNLKARTSPPMIKSLRLENP